jgi:two-component system, NarL family, nitrate/nitrite response regulator NarL
MKIVVCDDHLMFVEAITVAFTLRGHEVYGAATSQECIGRVAEHQPSVVTVDIGLPDGDVLTLVRDVRSAAPDAAVVVMSGRDPSPYAPGLLAAGVAGFLGKDDTTDEILDGLIRASCGELVGRAYSRRAARGPAPTQLEGRLRYLTPRERQVLARILAGDSTKEMARAMGISHSTTRTHVQNVLQKLGVNSRLQAAALVGQPGPDPHGDDGVDLIRLTYPSVLHG